jgi:hypothetical protein
MKIFFNSLMEKDGHLQTMTHNGDEKEASTCQYIEEILKTCVIKPNTVHSKLGKRFCASYLYDSYKSAYKPQGIIFATGENPAYCAPFDIMALTDGKTFTSRDFHSDFLKGYEKFIFRSIDEMISEYKNSKDAIKALNDFRSQNGIWNVDKKSMDYNECCFENPIRISPIALVGESSSIKKVALENQIPVYEHLGDYFLVMHEE